MVREGLWRRRGRNHAVLRGGRRGPRCPAVFPRGRGRASPEGAIGVDPRGPWPARRSLGGAGGVLPVPGRGLAARLQHQLVEDVGDVALHGVRAEVEGAGDQLVAVAGGDVAQHLELARAERNRWGAGGQARSRRCRREPGGRAGAAAGAGSIAAQARRVASAAAGSRPCQSAAASARRFVAPSISAPAPGRPSRRAFGHGAARARPPPRRRGRVEVRQGELEPDLGRLAVHAQASASASASM